MSESDESFQRWVFPPRGKEKDLAVTTWLTKVEKKRYITKFKIKI